MTLTIRDAGPADEAVWRELWAGYLDFYEAIIPAHVTDLTWARIAGDDPVFSTVVAEVDGEVIGFANIVLHDFTWSDQPAALLHDLYVRPDRRGGGTGRALIDFLVERGRREGWNRVYWLTKHDNAPARRLYESIVPADGFIRYRVVL